MNSFTEIFDLMKSNLELTDIARKTFIDAINPLSLSGNIAVLAVDAPFIRQVLEDNYSETFKKHLSEIMGFPVEVKIVCSASDNAPPPPKSAAAPLPSVSIPELQDDHIIMEKLNRSLLDSNYQYTFDTFIVGDSNNLACSACRAVANGTASYNPLYIYGNPGLGKTHLLSAVRNELAAKNPNLKIVFVSAENFVNDFVDSITYKKTAEFKARYRKADVFLIDDVHFFSRKEESQQELFNTFNELHGNKKQIILTSDRAPKLIPNIEDRLRSRFEWGLLADISPPEFETRIAIIQRKADLMGLTINPLIVEFIADRLKSNIRQLEGAITKIHAIVTVQGIMPTLSLAQSVTKEILDENPPKTIAVESIINEVAMVYGLTGEELRSKKRAANISSARQIAIYVVHNVTGLPYTEIGRQFGGRDHSTVVYAVGKVKDIMNTNPGFRGDVEELIRNIKTMQG